MLANNEETAACVYLTQKRAGTKITISNPQILCGDCFEHRSQQRALLRMPIFTRKDIGDQTVGRLIDHERLAWQGPPGGLTQSCESMLAGFQTVAVDNFDPIAIEPGRTLTAHVRNQWDELAGTIAHEFRGGARLQAIEFVIDGDNGGPHVGFVSQVRCTHGGLDTKDHLAHQVIDGGKQEFARVLFLGRALIPEIEAIGAQHPLQRRAHHYRDRTLFDKAFKHSAEHAGPPTELNFRRPTVYNITPPLHRWLIDHERLAWQGPPGGLTQSCESMLAGFQTVAVDNFDPIASEPGRTLTAYVRNQWDELAGTIAHEFCGGASLQAIEFVIDGDNGGPHVGFVSQVRCTHGGLDTKDHLAHQVIDGGKQEFARVLFLGRALIPEIEAIGAQHPLQRRAHHHRDRTLFDKAFKHSAEHAGPPTELNFRRPTVYNITPPLHRWAESAPAKRLGGPASFSGGGLSPVPLRPPGSPHPPARHAGWRAPTRPSHRSRRWPI